MITCYLIFILVALILRNKLDMKNFSIKLKQVLIHVKNDFFIFPSRKF